MGQHEINSGLEWMYMVLRSTLALRVQVEVCFRIFLHGLFEWMRAEEMCVNHWVRGFFCAIWHLV